MNHVNKTGYIYILQNNSHGKLVLKIGLTRGRPELRSKELYRGSTGVPEHFNILYAFSVGDCFRAEAEVHRRLDSYRINPRREFFKIKPSVARSIAYDTCTSINSSLGLDAPEEFQFDVDQPRGYLKKVPEINNKGANYSFASLSEISSLKFAPVGTSLLTDSQIERIKILYLILENVEETVFSDFLINFSRDKYPDREIIIWENIAKAFQEFESTTQREVEALEKAYYFLIIASMFSGKDLEKAISKIHLSFEEISELVNYIKP